MGVVEENDDAQASNAAWIAGISISGTPLYVTRKEVFTSACLKDRAGSAAIDFAVELNGAAYVKPHGAGIDSTVSACAGEIDASVENISAVDMAREFTTLAEKRMVKIL